MFPLVSFMRSAFEVVNHPFYIGFLVEGRSIRITSYNVCYTKLLRDDAKKGRNPERSLKWAAGMVDDRQWFIQKAIGWWLRELSKHNPSYNFV